MPVALDVAELAGERGAAGSVRSKMKVLPEPKPLAKSCRSAGISCSV